VGIYNIVQVGKADVNYVDRWGNTSFSEADRMSMWEQALYLWKQGASIKGLKRANGSKIKLRFDTCHSLHLLTSFRIELAHLESSDFIERAVGTI
jgi:hypothetical protein